MKRTPHQKHLTDEDVTIEMLEECLDYFAGQIEYLGKKGEVLFPLWERVEREIETRRRKQDTLAAVRERIKQSRDRKAIRS